ncbi:unnamed protein product, partial [Owenia fusiformis]
QCSNKVIPKSKFRKFLKPFWKTGNLGPLHKAMKQARTIWIRDGSPRGLAFDSFRNYKLQKRAFTRQLKRLKFEYDQKQLKDLQDAAEVDSALFYRLVKNHNGHSKCNLNIGHELLVDGIMIRDPDLIRGAWVDHYERLGKESNHHHFDNNFHDYIENQFPLMLEKSHSMHDGIFEDPITFDELSHSLSTFNNGKAPGHDLVTIEHFKFCDTIVLHYLCRIFNAMIRIAKIPPAFKL